MTRPSLPAAITPFRGRPAGSLQVACETLLCPVLKRERWTMGLTRHWLEQSFSLLHSVLRSPLLNPTISYSCKAELFSTNPVLSISSHFLWHSYRLSSSSVLPERLWWVFCQFCCTSTFFSLVTISQTLNRTQSRMCPTLFWVLRTPFDPLIVKTE